MDGIPVSPEMAGIGRNDRKYGTRSNTCLPAGPERISNFGRNCSENKTEQLSAMAKEGSTGEREAAEESIVWREEARRFETPDGEAFLEYRLVVQPLPSSCGGGATLALMDMVHTYVPGSKRGRGLAALLCDAAFAHARRHGMRVVPTCSYISDTYLPRNAAWNELVYKDDEPKPSTTSSSM